MYKTTDNNIRVLLCLSPSFLALQYDIDAGVFFVVLQVFEYDICACEASFMSSFVGKCSSHFLLSTYKAFHSYHKHLHFYGNCHPVLAVVVLLATGDRDLSPETP
jgi:hypothetical protein